jgi:acylphosphatase
VCYARVLWLRDCIFRGSSFRITRLKTFIIRVRIFDMRVARKYLISGEVQGVGYRFFAQRVAARHQVVGYVRNLEDGRVEVLAEGALESVEGLKHDLAVGPQFGHVEQVEELNLEPTGSYVSFRIER